MKKIFTYTFLLVLGVITLSYAQEYTFDQAIEQYTKLDLKQPVPEEDGRIQTLNRKGAMSPQLDEATTQFIEFSQDKKVLEVGGAYGKVMIQVLKKYPNTVYHLNDLDPRHLFIAAHQAKEYNLADKALKNIKFFAFDITSPLQIQERYDAILMARVLHFFSPTQLDAAISNIFHLLKPKGRVYVIAITPYVKRYESFIPEYEKRVLSQQEYPGYVDSLEVWLNKPATTPSQQAVISDEPFMFLDDNVLRKVFQKHGFNIITCKMVGLSYVSSSWSLDGRENVILIAEKPGHTGD